MLTTTHRRLIVPLFGLGASALVLAGCGSDSDGGSPFSSSGPSSQVQSQAVSSPNDVSPAPVTSDTGSSDSADSSDSSGGSRSVAAFCDAYDLDVVKNAGTDPQAAIVVLRKVKDVAPDAIRADAEFIYNALNDAAGGKVPDDVSKITDASANVARYFVDNCS